jgi:hypothetical protein
VILLVLIALAARVDAAPGDASITQAIRYANLLTGTRDLDDNDEPGDADDADTATSDADSDADDAQADDIGITSDARDISDPDAGDPSARAELAYDADRDRDDMGHGDATTDGNAGQLATLDAEQAPAGVPTGDDAIIAASPAGAAEAYESWMRHPRPSRWGRLDVSLTWRRLWSDPLHTSPHRSDSVWLVATWRR